MKRGLFALSLLLGSLACKPPTLYEWGNYETSLYKLMKEPASASHYGLSLVKQIEQGEAQGKVPPGIYAEYGYFLYANQQPKEAAVWFEKERTRWPESAQLMDKMISNCKASKPAGKPSGVPSVKES